MDKEFKLKSERDFEERVKHTVLSMLKGNAFTERKLTDTPTDSFSVVNRGYMQKNGTIANRPTSSVATVGQFYLATDTNIPSWYTTTGWRDGKGSIIASA